MHLGHAMAEREAARLLPGLIDELFDHQEQPIHVRHADPIPDRGFDLSGLGHGRDWLFEVKSSSSPGLIARAAASLERSSPDALRVLVVPFMTPAGEKAARQFGLNWIDLSGNAHIRADNLYISVTGRPNQFVKRGRPSSPFAPKSARISRVMLLEPGRWWRRKDLSETTDLDSGQVSRVVKRLLELGLLEEDGPLVRPGNPDALLDAWEDEYRFDRHEIVRGHISGSGIELSRILEKRLGEVGSRHAFTGLPAAWAIERFARFRLNSVYIDDDPHRVAEQIGMRVNERGANVQLISPDDLGVFAGAHSIEDLMCVAPVQAYLDLKHLPERAAEAASDLRARGLWNGS